MNKYIIVTSIALSLFASVSAQTVVKQTPVYMPQKIETTFPSFTTDDTTLNAKILDLQKAEIAKMKTMHAETYTKIKVLLGNKKATTKFPLVVNSTSRTGAELDKICTLRMAAKGVKQNPATLTSVNSSNGVNSQMNNTFNQAQVPAQQAPVAGFRGFINKLFGWQ